MLSKNTTAQLLIACSLLLTSLAAHAVEPRIVGGVVAPNHAYPFMVAIEFSIDNFQFCGGTLVAPNKVLTAGHCLDTTEAVHIRVGTNNRTIDPGQTVSVISQVRHPKYSDITLDYDVAIFTLASNVVLNDARNLVKLPEACGSLQCITGLAKSGAIVRTAGWGATNPNGTSPSLDLRQVDVPLTDNTTCNSAIGGITARMICAGLSTGGKDSCSGDSGGPLFGYLASARTGLQTGIVSWGIGNCGDPGTYGVYTRISNPEIRSFIRAQTGK